MRNRRRKVSFLFPVVMVGTVFIFAFSRNKTQLQSVLSLNSYDEFGCGCPRLGPPLTLVDKTSLCSEWSTARGGGQRVIAYTIYGNHGNRKVLEHYYNQIEDRIKEANFHYEGWIVRLYHNATRKNKFTNQLICKLFCRYPSFDPCQVNTLYISTTWTDNRSSSDSTGDPDGSLAKSSKKDNVTSLMIENIQVKILDFLTFLTNPAEPNYGSLENETTAINEDGDQETKKRGTGKSFGEALVGKLWRFLPLGDDTVDLFLVRDVDSFILPREVYAVRQWLQNSTAMIHAMRDHPSHNGVILAGMWGGARWRAKEKMTGFLKRIISYPPRNLWNYDQIMLKRIIWPDVIDSILVHDSYHCWNPFLQAKHRALPFPTKRRGILFVSWGPNRSPSELKGIVPCPLECRPKDHPEWEFC